MKNNSFEIDMTNGPIMPKLISFCVPLVLSGILQLLFNAVDIIVVGRFAGHESLAAVGSTTALISMMVNLFIGISLGTNVLSARYYASGKNEELSLSVHTSILTALISGILMLFIGLFLSRTALQLMGTPGDVIDLSVLYMKIYFCGMPFFMLYNFAAAVLRAVGDTRRPLLYLTFAGIINAIVNLILVICFHMGVAGVAIATVFSQLISCILVLRCLMRVEGSYRLDLKKLAIDKNCLVKLFQIGLPAGLQSTVINFSNALLQSSVNSFGSIAMAGYAASNNLFGILYTSVNSVSQGCMSFTSQNYGAKKPKRIDTVVIDTMILEVVIGTLFGVGMYLCGPQLLHIYTPDPKVVADGMQILTIGAIPYFLCGIMDAFPGCMRGLGRAMMPMILSVIGTVGFRLVWILELFPHHRTLMYLFICYPGSWLLTILMQLIYFFYIRKKIYMELA